MICPKCKEEEKKSIVYAGYGMSTLVGYTPYYDEDGKYHSHDPNSNTTNYTCSNGHSFSVSRKSPCPNCDYGKDFEKIRINEKSDSNNVSFGSGTITFTTGSGMTFNTTTSSSNITATNNNNITQP